jgi:hypothetical protein
MAHASKSTEYNINPDYYRFMYEKLKNRKGEDFSTGAIIGFILSVLLYLMITCAPH